MTTPPPTPHEIEQAIKILRDDAILAGHAAIVERMDRMEARLNRTPVKEMSPEEKAAEYDKLMAERNAPKPPDPEPPKPAPGSPVPPPAKEPDPPKGRRDPFFGDRLMHSD
jgi:hypothetical protein